MLYGVLIPLAAALILMASKRLKPAEYITVLAAGAGALWAGTIAFYALYGYVFDGLGGLFRADALSAYILLIIAGLSFATAVYSVGYMRGELSRLAITEKALKFYYVLFNLFVFTMMLIPISNNLAFLWIAIEATTLVSALLVGIYKRQNSIEAAWKYIILCTVGITFALLGTFVIYYASAEAGTGTLDWTELSRMAHGLNPATVRLAFILIIVGYGTKAGLAPVHNWLPDAHSEAPTPVSALLSGILLNCAFYGVMRFAAIADKSCGHAFVQEIMVFFGLASIIIPAIFILIQSNAKRLLAYSSIEHMGIIALAFGIGGVWGIYAALLHILNHALGKPLMFFVMGRVHSQYHSVEMGEVRGVLGVNPLIAVIGFAGAMCLAGMPPFNIFLSEFLMIKTLAAGSYWGIMATFLAASGFVFYGFLKGFGGMFLGKPSLEHGEPVSFRASDTVLVVMGMGILLLGLSIPGPLNKLINLSIGALGV